MKKMTLKYDYIAGNNPLLSYKNKCKNLHNVLIAIKVNNSINFGAFYQKNNIGLDGFINYESKYGNEVIFY